MATNISNFDLELNYNEAKALVKHCVLFKEPIMLHGKPGIGKSDLIREIANELTWEDSEGNLQPWVFIDIRLALLESVDIKGYPYLSEIKTIDNDGNERVEKVLSFAMNKEFPRVDPKEPNKKWIVFFDEINAAQQSTQLAMYQMILDRAIGEYVLPSGASMVAAGNREADKGGTFTMPKPLENRFVHLELNTTFDNWVNWAIEKDIISEIIGFVAKNQQKLNMFDPKHSNRAFATPRSWAKFSKLLTAYLAGNQKSDESQIHNIASGCIGVPTAIEFMAFRAIAGDIPSAEDILDGKSPKLKKDGIDISYMLITNVMHKIREYYQEENKLSTKSDKKIKPSAKLTAKIDNFFQYLIDNEKMIGADFCVLPIKMLYNNYNIAINAADTPSMMKLIKKHGDLMSLAFDK